MSMENVDDISNMQRDFADVDINNGADSNNEDEQEEEEVPSPATNNNGLSQSSIHVSY